MKNTFKQVIALFLVAFLTLPLLASCGNEAAENEENEIVTEVDGIPVFDQYKSRKIDLGLAEDEKLYDIIEIDGQLRATVGVLDPDYDPNSHDYFYHGIPYPTEHRWYSLDYVEDTTRREKTLPYQEITFPADPDIDFTYGGVVIEDEWGKGLQYHFYQRGEMLNDVLISLDYGFLTDPNDPNKTPQAFGHTSQLMVCDGVPFLCYNEIATTDEGIEYKDTTTWGQFLYINGHYVDIRNWNPGDPNYTFWGLIGIRGEPYALLEIDEKGRLIPLTPETTEMTFDGTDIDGCPTGGAFTDGRFGYFMSGTELWRTDGEESKCIVDLVPYGGSLTSVVRSVRALSDGRLLIAVDGKLIELDELVGEEEKMQICDVGVINYDGWRDDLNVLVSKYNDQAENSFIRVKDYEDVGNMNLAILSGDVDMVITPDRFVLINYIKQELLVPLEEVAPALFEKDALIESVVDAARVDGVCYYLPVNFELCGEYITDPSSLPDGKLFENRVEYYDYIIKNDPEYFKINDTDWILDNFANDLDEWIDWENNTCHFDDGTFAAMLELCAKGCTWEQSMEHFQSKGPLGEWWSRDEKAGSFRLTNGVESYRFTDVKSAQDYQKGLPASKEKYAGPTTWVQVDFPMPSSVHEGYAIDAHNLYAIVDHEDSKAVAADFLQWLILEEVIEEFPENETGDFFATGWDGFSINKDETDRYLRRLLNGYLDPEEEAASANPEAVKIDPSVRASLRYWAQDFNAMCGETQYEITWSHIEKIDHLLYYDNEIQKVIESEAKGFFTGANTAEKAAEYVQNRISLYLAEQS